MLGGVLCGHGGLAVGFAAVGVCESLFLGRLRGVGSCIFIPDIAVCGLFILERFCSDFDRNSIGDC